jgi:hypothetical protein
MSMTDKKKREPEFDPAEVRALSVAVYKARLVQDSGEGAVERMIAADKDTGEKLAGRAAAYDALTRCYMRVARLAEAKLEYAKRQLAEAREALNRAETWARDEVAGKAGCLLPCACDNQPWADGRDCMSVARAAIAAHAAAMGTKE